MYAEQAGEQKGIVHETERFQYASAFS